MSNEKTDMVRCFTESMTALKNRRDELTAKMDAIVTDPALGCPAEFLEMVRRIERLDAYIEKMEERYGKFVSR